LCQPKQRIFVGSEEWTDQKVKAYDAHLQANREKTEVIKQEEPKFQYETFDSSSEGEEMS
jgi:hypothetical protein